MLQDEERRTTGNDQHRTLDWIHRGRLRCNGQELAHRHRLPRAIAQFQKCWCKGPGREEVALHAGHISCCQVAVWVAPKTGVPVRLNKVAAKGKVGHVSARLREARQDQTIRSFRVEDRERVTLDASERVANVLDLVEGAMDAWDRTGAELHRQVVEGGYLQRRLDFIDGLAMLRHAHAEAIPSEGAVAIFVCRFGHVGVVVVVDTDVPVGAVETNAVGEQLNEAGGTRVGLAVGRRDFVCLFDGSILLNAY